MKLTINTKSFTDAVSWVTKSYDSKNDKAYITLSINEDAQGSLSHMNPTSYMKSDFSVISVDFDDDEDTDVQLAVDGKYLDRLAKSLNGTKEITITNKINSKKTSLDVKSSLGKFTIPLVDTKISSAPEIVEIGEVDDNEFFDSLLRIAKLCDPANSGASLFLGSVDLGFDKDNDKVKMFATDRFAMGEITLDFSPVDDDNETMQALTDKHILLPYNSAILVPPTKGINTSITLIGEESSQGNSALKFGYSFPDGRIALFSLVNFQTFSQVEQMKKKALDTVEHSIIVETSALTNAIKVVSNLAWDEENIYLNISKKNGLIVSDVNNTNSLKVEHSHIDYDSKDDYRAKFLRLTINEAFSPVSTSKVALKWGPKSNAFIFEPITDDDEALDNIFVMAVLGRN